MPHQAGRTRWRRFAAILVTSISACAVLGIAMAQGALAASFFISGQTFKIAADTLTARGVSIYSMVDVTRKHELVPVVVTGTRHATISGLCQSVLVDIPVLGPQTLRITSGYERPATASNLFLDITSQSADEAQFKGLDIGVAQGAITKGPINPGDRNSRFFDPDGVGQQADSSTLTQVRWTTVALSSSTFNLPDLRLQLKPGNHECF
ncbi:DUF6230 family protein [Streptomyces carpinensis]|uniref:DUF6230 family protein n=1 Tax=Streptomyces carpinensis TaxID=66369 RepID=A0ABV1WI99_9ACTN|nr:DUF6230 family protein [Streptomyces carpinensis]